MAASSSRSIYARPARLPVRVAARPIANADCPRSRGVRARCHADRIGNESIANRIENLVAEEQSLRRREQADSSDVERLEEDKRRLRAVEVELDRCWDLLRQRRARGESGQDPDDAEVRDAETVERYLQ